MGACLTLARALALNDSNGGPFPVEFSVVAVFPSCSRDLRGRSAASEVRISYPGYSGARSRSSNRYRHVDLARSRLLRFSVDLDFPRLRGDLVPFGAFPA